MRRFFMVFFILALFLAGALVFLRVGGIFGDGGGSGVGVSISEDTGSGSEGAGTIWTVRTFNKHFYGITYGNGKFVAVGSWSTILTSP